MLAQDEFVEILAPMVAYCRDEVDETLAGLYFEKLKDLSPGSLQAAVHHWMSTSNDRWLPSIGRIRELAALYKHGRRWTWQEAWSLILEATDVFSPHDKRLSDKAHEMVGELMPYVREAGGFLTLMSCDARTLAVKQSNFRHSYQQIEERRVEQEKLPEGTQIPQPIIEQTAKALGLPNMKPEGH